MTAGRLAEYLGLDTETAARVLRLIRREESPFTVPAVDDWRKQCLHEPRASSPEAILMAIDHVIGTSGTEAIWGDNPLTPVAEYCNSGDTYSPTLLFDYMTRQYRLTTYGDWVERYGDRYGVK